MVRFGKRVEPLKFCTDANCGVSDLITFFWPFERSSLYSALFDINKLFAPSSPVDVGRWPNHVIIGVFFPLIFSFLALSYFLDLFFAVPILTNWYQSLSIPFED